MKSIIQKDKVCLVTGSRQNLHKHHCLNGGLRNFAEREGLYVFLDWQVHKNLHDKGNRAIELKRIAQYVYELNHSHQEWMNNVHKNYLLEPISDNELKRYGLYQKQQV